MWYPMITWLISAQEKNENWPKWRHLRLHRFQIGSKIEDKEKEQQKQREQHYGTFSFLANFRCTCLSWIQRILKLSSEINLNMKLPKFSDPILIPDRRVLSHRGPSWRGSTNPLVVGWYVFHRSESELSNQILIWTGDDCDDYDSFPKIELTVEPKA